MRRALAVAALLALAGCGGSPEPTATPPPTRSSTAPAPSVQPPSGPGGGSYKPYNPLPPYNPAPQTAGPSGHLSDAEFRAITREYTLIKPLQRTHHGFSAAARRARPACDAVREPNTRLVRLVQLDCFQALYFADALGHFETAADRCKAAIAGGDPSCLADRYAALGVSTDGVIRSGKSLNAELAHRHIGGICARSIGLPGGAQRGLARMAKAARGAASALLIRDQDLFDTEQRALLRAANRLGSSDPLKGIERGCRHAKGGPVLPRPIDPDAPGLVPA